MSKKSLIFITCITPTLSYSMDNIASLPSSGTQVSSTSSALSSSSPALSQALIQTGIDPMKLICKQNPDGSTYVTGLPTQRVYTAIMLERARVAKKLYPYETCKWFTHPNEDANNKILLLTKQIPQPTDPRWTQWKQEIMEAVRAGGNTNTNLLSGLPQAIALESYGQETHVRYNPTPPINQVLSAVVQSGDTECVKELIQHGAFVNANDIYNGDGPLASAKTVTMATILYLKGAEPKYFIDKFRNTLLHKVMEKEYEAPLILIYAELGVNPNQQGGESNVTASHALVDQTRDLSYPIQAILKKAEFLTKVGADNKTVNIDGETPSQYAQHMKGLVSPEAAERCELLKKLFEARQ